MRSSPTIADQFGHARATLVARLTPMVTEAYEQLAGAPVPIDMQLRAAVAQRPGSPPPSREARAVDVRRGVSTVGPHRDELQLSIKRPAEPHARVAG